MCFQSSRLRRSYPSERQGDASCTATVSLTAGTRVGRYEIRSLLGEAYRETDTQLGREVALNSFPRMAADRTRMSRFIQEARATSALNHPSIVTMYDVEQTGVGVQFFVAELVTGDTLRERVRRGPLKIGEAFDSAAQIASALVAACRRHRPSLS